MTLSGRNSVLKAGIALSSAFLVAGLTASFFAIPALARMDAGEMARAQGWFQTLTAWRVGPSLLAAHFTALAPALYSLLALAFVYSFFEKTQSPEILFVAFFAASLAPEVLRLAIPLGEVRDIPSLYLAASSRAIIFSRYFGIFSMFAASVHAAGYKSQQNRGAILMIAAVALFIALGVPVDTHARDTSLAVLSGYASMFRLVEIGVFLMTAVSFLVAARTRGSRRFLVIAMGATLAMAGRDALIRGDTWIALAVGLPMLCAGTWLVCKRLHGIYLWL